MQILTQPIGFATYIILLLLKRALTVRKQK